MELSNFTHKGIDDALKNNAHLEILDAESTSVFMSEMEGTSEDTEVPIVKINSRIIAEEFLKDNGFTDSGVRTMHYYNGAFLIWNGKCYKRMSIDEFKLVLFKWCIEKSQYVLKIKNSHVNEALLHIQAEMLLNTDLIIPSFVKNSSKNPSDFIVLENGLFSLEAFLNEKSQLLLEHDPDFLSMANIPTEYNPTAQCPTFLKYLEEVQPDPDIRKLLQQWVGYNLIYSYKFHNFMLFVGEGANGKSVFCTVMASLLGDANICAVSLEAFDEKRSFQIASTFGKLANIVEELNELFKKNYFRRTYYSRKKI